MNYYDKMIIRLLRVNTIFNISYNKDFLVKVLLIMGCLNIASCRPIAFYYAQPSGPPEYRLGWEDGCDSGISATDTFTYKILYGFRKRPEFGNNELYKTAWNEGYAYCSNGAAHTEKWDIGVDY